MRTAGWMFLFTAMLAAQESRTYSSSSLDINGHRVYDPQVTLTKSKDGTERTEKMQSLNGRLVPLETVEDRVVRDDASGKVVERSIRRYDSEGRPTQPEKVVIEQTSTTVRTTVYRGDLNGNMPAVERSVTETHKNGSTENSDTVVERRSLDGSFEAVEKRSAVKTESSGGYQENATTYRRGANGFYEALRVVTEHNESGGTATDNVAEYEPGSQGNLESHSQSVRTISKRPDGSQSAQVDLFSKRVPGIARSSDAHGLQLEERQIIERRSDSGDAMTETVSVRRPTVSDPGALGPPKVISETVCRGQCK
jgi:hypothetical protein